MLFSSSSKSFFPIPSRRHFPHPYQIQHLKKLLCLSPSFACMLGLLLGLKLLPIPMINIKFYLLAFWHFQHLTLFNSSDVSGPRPEENQKVNKHLSSNPSPALESSLKKVLVRFHTKEIGSFVCYTLSLSLCLTCKEICLKHFFSAHFCLFVFALQKC